MSLTGHKIMKSVAPVLVLAALAASDAQAANQDLRSPDVRMSAAASVRDFQDLRSPDAREYEVASPVRDSQDLRSPDARDVARGASDPLPLATTSGEASGSNRDVVGIAAGGVFGLALVVLAGMFHMHRRRIARKPGAPVVSS